MEHRRAHNICIELSGIRKPFAEIKVCLHSCAIAPCCIYSCQRWSVLNQLFKNLQCIHTLFLFCSAQSGIWPCTTLAHSPPPVPTTHPWQDALLRMDDSALTVEQLAALGRAVPDDTERKELELYLRGEHPKYK